MMQSAAGNSDGDEMIMVGADEDEETANTTINNKS